MLSNCNVEKNALACIKCSKCHYTKKKGRRADKSVLAQWEFTNLTINLDE